MSKVAGEQRYVPDKSYRPSHFVLAADCGEGLLLYNTLTGELLLLDRKEAGQWPNSGEYLVKHWFLVPQDFDELRHCEQIRTVLRLTQPVKKNISRYVIFTTTDCNARCFYCFEKGQRRFSMTEQTARDTARYILNHAGENIIAIRWFGGEPLYNVGVIDSISQILRDAGASFESTMVSNAYLFDAEMVEKARTLWHLRNVIVTLDGTEEVYNRTKAFIYRGDSAFRRVLGNIDRLLDAGISVTVNLNMDARNAQDLFDLADQLGQRYAGKTMLRARAALLIEYESKISHFETPQQALETLQALNERLASYGIREKRRLSSHLKINSCMADDPGSATILPDGRIGRCEHFGDSEEVGSIYEETWDKQKTAAWTELHPAGEACRTCAAYPQCLRLKKCNGFSGICSELNRIQRILELKDKMLNTYEKWKLDSETETGGH